MESEKEKILQLLHSDNVSNYKIAHQILISCASLQDELCDKTLVSDFINSHHTEKIKIAVLLINKHPTLKEWAENRYRPLLNFLEINDLDRLVKVPLKLSLIKKNWDMEIDIYRWNLSDTFEQHLVRLNNIDAASTSPSIQKLPEFLFNLPNLQYLQISKSSLKVLPDRLDKLPFLRYFYIEDSKLSDLPESFGKLLRLEHLSLKGNLFEELPTVLQNCTNLTTLNLDQNKKMTALPEWIKNLTKLEKLSFWGTKINDRLHPL